MTQKIITGVMAEVSSTDQIFRYLITTDSYHDPAIAAQIYKGVALPFIPEDASFDIDESIFFQPQGGNSGTSIGQIPIINDAGYFDDWVTRNVAGMSWEIRRGHEDQPWAEWEILFSGEGRGRPEFIGNRIIVSVRDKFGYMREPVAQAVFDDATPNQSLINTTAPMIFGEAYQVRPPLADPTVLAYFAADNLAQVFSVSEGGNPETPQWVRLPQGAQLTASPSLVITADIAGPPSENPDESPDVLDGQGQFDSWSGGELDYPDLTVSSTTGGSLTEGDSSGVLQIDPSISLDTGWKTGTTVFPPNYDPGAGRGAQNLKVVDFDMGLPEGAIVTGIEIETSVQWHEMSGSTVKAELVTSLGIDTPAGLLFGAIPADAEFHSGFYTAMSVGGQYDTLGATDQYLTAEIVNDPDFAVHIKTNLYTSQNLLISNTRIKIYYVTQVQWVRMLWDSVLEMGRRYTISIESVGAESPEDSVLADWSASVDEQDPQSARSAKIGGATTHEYVFTAGSENLDLYFYQGNGNGAQELLSITVRKGSSAINTYHDLIRYLHSSAGRDPDEVCDNDSLALVQAQADNPRLGHYVTDQTTREQLSTYLSHSLSAVTWGGIDGKWKAAQLRIPSRPDGDYLRVVNAFSEPSAVPDYADDLRDRVHAAKNFYPMPEGEAAGITTNWTRNQREQILADWRITERADFANLIDYEGRGVLAIDSVAPGSGSVDGGTAITIVGAGYWPDAKVEIGGVSAFSVVVVDKNTITCETPPGATGFTDVVVRSSGQSITLPAGFEYILSPVHFDSVSVGVSSTDDLTISHATAAQDDRYMIVSVHIDDAETSVDSVEYGSQPLTEILTVTEGERTLSVWAIAAPAVGVEGVVITLPGAAEFGATVRTFYGVDQSAPVRDSGVVSDATGEDASIVLSALEGDMLVDMLALKTPDTDVPDVLPDTDQLTDAATFAGGPDAVVVAASHKQAEGATDSTGWSWTGDDDHVLFAVALKRL